MPSSSYDRTVITGIGAYCAAGAVIDEIWEGILAGQSFVQEYADVAFRDWPGKMFVAGQPTGQFGPQHLAFDEALRASQLELPNPNIGFSFGASKGRLVDPSETYIGLTESNTAYGHPHYPLPPNSLGDDLLEVNLLRGNATCPVAACASGLVALIQAARWIEWGQCEAVIAGSIDFSIHPLVIASYRRLGVLSHWSGPPAAACRPFDRDRSGFVIGEGAGVLVLESETNAAQRGATPLAIWSGHDHRTDPTGLIDSDPDGEVISVVVRNAIEHANLKANDIDAICCHGTGTNANDQSEAIALRRVFGSDLDDTPCFSLKGSIGHTLGASGSVETAICVKALESQTLPPHLNADNIDPACPIGPVPKQRTNMRLRHILKLSYGFGGHVAAAVISKLER